MLSNRSIMAFAVILVAALWFLSGTRGDPTLAGDVTGPASNTTLAALDRVDVTVPSGSATATGSHDLGATPSTIVCEPQSDPGARHWVSARDASTFTLTLGAAPAGDVAFDCVVWE